MMIFFTAMGACLCVAAVQALRKHWKNSIIGLLSAVIFFLLAALYAQSHTGAIRRARETAFRAKIKNLEEQMKQKDEPENRTTN